MLAMDIQTIFRRIYSFLIRTNIAVLILVPIFAGIALLAMLLIIWPNGYNGSHVQDLWLSFSWFCMGLSGIPKIVRRESFYGPIHFTGVLAIIDGVFSIIIFWILASIPFVTWNR
jgi:hypothetical protein